MRYVNLMGEHKPHLLVRTINNLGAETRVDYAPSTKFYLQDKRAGKPWITRLPFPVHVVERVETYDHISRNRFVTRYAYHHGYFDGEEREFRGFGMVEQWDTEAFEDYVVGVQRVDGAQELAPELNQPPVTTRTWYHTGAFLDQTAILHQYRHEYYRQEQHIPEPVLPAGLSAGELRECVRALEGPAAAAGDLQLRRLARSRSIPTPSPRTTSRFAGCSRAAASDTASSFPWAGSPSRSTTSATRPTLASRTPSAWSSTSTATPASPARSSTAARSPMPSLPAEVTRDQQQPYITYAEADYTPDIEQAVPAEAYRLRVPFESRNYEITGIAPAAAFFQFDELKAKIAGAAPIDYEVDRGRRDAAEAPALPQPHALPRQRAEPLAAGPMGLAGSRSPELPARLHARRHGRALRRQGHRRRVRRRGLCAFRWRRQLVDAVRHGDLSRRSSRALLPPDRRQGSLRPGDDRHASTSTTCSSRRWRSSRRRGTSSPQSTTTASSARC